MPAVAITRGELSAADLRREAARTKDADAARRMLALALVVEGWRRTEAARACGMDRQALRNWVHCYNADGVAGLSDRSHPGRPPRLTAAQMREREALVEKVPTRRSMVRCAGGA
jgi:transposase